jgi:hypothetical protein
MVAKKLESKIRDTLLTASRSHVTSSLFAQDATGLSNLQRPRTFLYLFVVHRTSKSLPNVVLLILDRNVDLISMLSHGWTYQALVSDCLEFKLNRVVRRPTSESDHMTLTQKISSGNETPLIRSRRSQKKLMQI